MKRRKKRDKEGARAPMPFKKTANGMTLEVRVQPRASRVGIEGVQEGVLRVRLTAPPVGGEANAQLVELISEELGVRKSSVKIIKGRSSKNKVVEITGDMPSS